MADEFCVVCLAKILALPEELRSALIESDFQENGGTLEGALKLISGDCKPNKNYPFDDDGNRLYDVYIVGIGNAIGWITQDMAYIEY